MLTVGFFPNIKKNTVLPVLAQAIRFLEGRKARVAVPAAVAQILSRPELAIGTENLSQLDAAVTLGGDGTFLSVVRRLAPFGVPVCGVNMGRLGFLTEVEVPELEVLLTKLIEGNYQVQTRMMLTAQVYRDQHVVYTSTALNDAVITKGGIARIITLELSIDGCPTTSYRGDGLIVATTTGSTGYSLSAGGPIVNPQLAAMVITPICPHTLDARSLVITGEEKIRIRLQAMHHDIVMTADGQNAYPLRSQDVITVTKSDVEAKLLTINQRNYYETLRFKMYGGDAV